MRVESRISCPLFQEVAKPPSASLQEAHRYETQPEFQQISKLNGEDGLKLLRDGEVQHLYREYVKENANDLLRLIKAKTSLDAKIQKLVIPCEGAARFNYFLETQGRDVIDWLPRLGESRLIQLPDLIQRPDLILAPDSQVFRCIDPASNLPSIVPPIDLSQKQSFAMCLSEEINWEPALTDYIEPKYRHFEQFYSDDFSTYDQFKEIMTSEAIGNLKHFSHAQRWDQIKNRIEELPIRNIESNYLALKNKIAEHLREHCETVEWGPHNLSITISNCSGIPVASDSSTSMYKLGIAAILVVGVALTIFLAARSQKAAPAQNSSPKSLKDQIIEISFQSEEMRSGFLAKIDAELAIGNKVEQFKVDRDRLDSVINKRKEAEWIEIGKEFKSFLRSFLIKKPCDP